MRIAFFTTDSLASNGAARHVLARWSDHVVLVGLSPPFDRRRGGLVKQSVRHIRRSGVSFSTFLACNFLVPRLAGALRGDRTTLPGWCRSRGIPAVRVPDVNAPPFLETMTKLGVDVVVSAFFDQIFGHALLALPQRGAYNVHISPLPAHRGPMPVIQGCLDDPPQCGVTVHAIEPGIDTGPIVARETWHIPAGMTVLAAMEHLQMRGAEMLDRILPDIATGRAPLTPQSGGSYESFPDRATLTQLRRRGRRLCDRHDLARALRTPVAL